MLMLYFVSFLRFVRLACSKRESTVVVLIDVDEFTPALSIAWNLTVYVNMIPFWSALRTSFQATKILLKDVSTGLRFNGKPLGPKKKNQKKKNWDSLIEPVLLDVDENCFLPFFLFFFVKTVKLKVVKTFLRFMSAINGYSEPGLKIFSPWAIYGYVTANMKVITSRSEPNLSYFRNGYFGKKV